MASKSTRQSNFRRRSMHPKTLAQCIEPITRPTFKKQGLAGSKIISEWHSIVGEKLANHCLPQKLSFSAGKKVGGTLNVAVENGFATEIQHLQPIILERLAIYFGYKAVSRINISHTYTPKSEKPSEPLLKATLSKNCINTAKNVEDEELRAALISIAKTLSDTE